jgi:signal transduction histidine kinase
MRLATKLSLWLTLLYIPAFLAMGLWARGALRDSTDAVLSQTARLVASEIASAVSNDLLDGLASNNRRSHQRVEELLQDMVDRSDLVDGAALIGEDAKIFASVGIDLGARIGAKPQSTPAELFDRDRRPRFYADSESEVRQGRFILQVPVLRGENAAGYLSLTMTSEALRSLYYLSERRFLTFAAAALAIILALTFGLHLQLQRSAGQVASSIEAALAGKQAVVPRQRNEFSAALEAAGRLGKELADERRKSVVSRRQIANLGRLLDVGVLLLSPDGELDYTGARAREMLQLGDESEAHLRWGQVRHHFDPVIAEASAASGIIAQTVIDATTPGGPPLRLRSEVQQLVVDNDCSGYLVVLRDLEIVRAMEADLWNAARLRGLARIYMGMAHDLRAPLNAIGLNLELLRRSNLEDGDLEVAEQRGEWLVTVSRELERLNRGLSSLLAYTMLPEPSSTRFDIAPLLAEAHDLVSPQARQQAVTFEVRPASDRLVVEGNRDHLKQAVLSVVLNALEVMPNGGTLTIESDREGDHTVIRVRDTGPGVAVADRDKIFSLRYTTKEDGSGIGLYVARSIVEAHGGRLVLEVPSVEDSGAVGACFRFDFLST